MAKSSAPLSDEEKRFVILGIDLYCAILEEMDYPKAFAEVVKVNLLEDLEKNSRGWLPKEVREYLQARLQTKGLELPTGKQMKKTTKCLKSRQIGGLRKGVIPTDGEEVHQNRKS